MSSQKHGGVMPIFPDSFLEVARNIKITPDLLASGLKGLIATQAIPTLDERAFKLKSTVGEVWWDLPAGVMIGDYCRLILASRTFEEYLHVALNHVPYTKIGLASHRAVASHLRKLTSDHPDEVPFEELPRIALKSEHTLTAASRILREESDSDDSISFCYGLAKNLILGPDGGIDTSIYASAHELGMRNKLINFDDLVYSMVRNHHVGWYSKVLSKLEEGNKSLSVKWETYCMRYVYRKTLVDSFRRYDPLSKANVLYFDTSQSYNAWARYVSKHIKSNLARLDIGAGAWVVPQHPSISRLHAHMVRSLVNGATVNPIIKDYSQFENFLKKFLN